MTVFSLDYMIEIGRKLEAEGKLDDGRVLVRRGRMTLVLRPDQLGPDDEVIPDDDPYFRKRGRPRVVVEAWEEERAAEALACRLDAEARRQRQHLPMMGAAVCLPPPHLLKSIRSGTEPAIAEPRHRSLSAAGWRRIVREILARRARESDYARRRREETWERERRGRLPFEPTDSNLPPWGRPKP